MYEVNVILDSIAAQLRELAPYWASGLIVGSLVSVYLSERIGAKMAGLGSGRFRGLAVCGAAALGIASPLCMYGTVPVIAAFARKGVPQHLLAAFMISSVLLNPNLLLLSFVLGVEIALARLALAFVCGALAGVLILAAFSRRELFALERFAPPPDKAGKTFLRDLAKAFRITAPYLLFGVTITALFNRYVPPDFVAGMFGQRRGLGVLFATSLSIPLYACGGGVIPLIRAWLAAGMGSGDALAFMIAGPATKITNLSAVKMIFTAKNFVLYLAYCIGFAMASGLIVGLIL
ncbi:MAG: permease [Defluviitaleaceae bacterium]|nr:permease [Defluviitaleaceae bacterium]